MRVFIAVDLSAEAKKEIEKLLKVLKKKHWPVKWEELEKLHQTLVFLGSLFGDQVNQVYQACQRAVKEILPFEISFKGLGCFPNYDFPKIIWLGLRGDLKSLARLQKNLAIELNNIFVLHPDQSIKRIDKPFRPHISLGRIKNARTRERREIGRQLKQFRIYNLECKILVDKIIIYQSKLSSSGSVYKKLLEVPLK